MGPEEYIAFSGEGSCCSVADAMSANSRQCDDTDVPCRDRVRNSSAREHCNLVGGPYRNFQVTEGTHDAQKSS